MSYCLGKSRSLWVTSAFVCIFLLGSNQKVRAQSGPIPEGNQYNGIAYLGSGSSTTVGEIYSSTDSTKKQWNTPILNGVYDAFKNQTGGGNNGIANSWLAGANVVKVGPNYTGNETSVFTNNGSILFDLRKGQDRTYCSNPLTSLGTSAFCFVKNSVMRTRNQPYNNEHNTAIRTGAIFSGFGNSDDAAGAIYSAEGSNDGITTSYVPGLGSTVSTYLNCPHDEDCITGYKYINYGGDNHSGGAESTKWNAINTFEYPAILDDVLDSVTDQTTVRVKNVSNGRHTSGASVIGGTVLLNKVTTIDSGTAIADSNPASAGLPRTITTTSTHATTSAYGLIQVGIPRASSLPNGSPFTATINNLGTDFPPSGHACIKGGNHWEEVPFTATGSGATQTITLTTRYINAAPVFVAAGSCHFLQVPQEKQVAPNGAIRSYPYYVVLGAPDNTHYWYTSSLVFGGGYTIYSSSGPTPAGIFPVVTITSISRDANGVTTAITATNNSLQSYIQGATSLTVAGCADNSFNFTDANVNPIVLSNDPSMKPTYQWTYGSGAATTTGCTFQVTGRSGFEIFEGAEVTSVDNTNTPTVISDDPNYAPWIDGTYHLAPNTVGWTVNGAVEQPHGARLSVASTEGHTQNSPSINSTMDERRFVGWGMTGPGFMPHREVWYNQDVGGGALLDVSQFQGNGGTRPITPSWWTIQGNVFSNFIGWSYAPANGGTAFSIGCPMQGCGNNIPYNIFVNGSTYVGGGRLYFIPSSNTYGFVGKLNVSDVLTASTVTTTGNGLANSQFRYLVNNNSSYNLKTNIVSQNTLGASTWNGSAYIPATWTAQGFVANGNGCYAFLNSVVAAETFNPALVDASFCRTGVHDVTLRQANVGTLADLHVGNLTANGSAVCLSNGIGGSSNCPGPVTYSWTEATCSLSTVGSVCSATVHLPGAMPDASYQISCMANASSGIFAITASSSPLPTASGGAITVNIAAIAAPTSALTPSAMCFARHS